MFEITSAPIDSNRLKKEMADVLSGGFASFEGWVRNHNEGRAVLKLQYEAFEELARKEGEAILKECRERFAVRSVRCVHRVGELALSETAVWVGAAAAHRDEAFRACRFVIDEVKSRLPIWKKEHYVDGDAQWVNCQRCAEHDHPDGASQASEDEHLYYSRQRALPEIGEAGQGKLGQASVLVVGAGGLGCPVARSLAVSGVGRLMIMDGDRVEISNLHRQSLYRYADCGRPKAAVAKDALEQLNPFIRVEAIEAMATFRNAAQCIARSDVVVDCTDDLTMKFLLHDLCLKARKPFVMASVYQWEGEAQAFINDGSHACLRCVWPEIPARECARSCEDAGVLEAVPSLLGSLQAKLVLDVLLGRAVETRKLLVRLEGLDILKITAERRSDCWLCARNEALSESRYALSESRRGEVEDRAWNVPSASLELLRQEYELIDLRTAALADVTDFAALAQSKPRVKFLLICQRGRRSATLVRALREKDLHQFYSLEGGVNALP